MPLVKKMQIFESQYLKNEKRYQKNSNWYEISFENITKYQNIIKF